MMNNLLADIPLYPDGGLRGEGPLGLQEEGSEFFAPITFNSMITTIVGVFTVVAAIWFLINLLVGAIGMLTSGGDKAKLTEARGKITSSLLGLVIVIAAVFIVELVGQVFGIDNLLNPAYFILIGNP